MSSKLFTTVVAAVTILPFGLLTYNHAVSVTHNLQKQNEHIQHLTTESVKLDKKIETTTETKKQTETEVTELDQATQDAINERKKLEAELNGS